MGTYPPLRGGRGVCKLAIVDVGRVNLPYRLKRRMIVNSASFARTLKFFWVRCRPKEKPHLPL